MPISAGKSLLIILTVAGTIFFTRLMPFLFFPKNKPVPAVVQYLGMMLPPAVIGMLIIYCLKEVSLFRSPYGIPELLSIALVILLHVWKRNNLLSIGAGTIVYMILVQTIFQTP